MSAEATTSIGGVWARLEGQIVADQFPLRRFLGGSEHSAVFLTEAAKLAPSDAALKFVSIPSSTRAESQLARWYAVAGGLSHPHLVRLFDVGRCNVAGLGGLYALMEYADQDLAQLLQRRALTEEETREMLVPALSALAYLHERKLVMGRLKPSNILVVGDQLKLASDAIRAVGEVDDVRAASAYDPPESRDGSGSPAGDVWALGVTICEALTRRQPLGLMSGAGMVVLPPDLPPAFREIVGWCLRRQPQDRPEIAEIDAWLSGQPVAVVAAQSTQARDSAAHARDSAADELRADDLTADEVSASSRTVDVELAAGLESPPSKPAASGPAASAAAPGVAKPVPARPKPASAAPAASASPNAATATSTASAATTPAIAMSAVPAAPKSAADPASLNVATVTSVASAVPKGAPAKPVPPPTASKPAATLVAPFEPTRAAPQPGAETVPAIAKPAAPAARAAAPAPAAAPAAAKAAALAPAATNAPGPAAPKAPAAPASAAPAPAPAGAAAAPAAAAPAAAPAKAVPPPDRADTASKSNLAEARRARGRMRADLEADGATPPPRRSLIVLAFGVLVVIGVVWAGIRVFGTRAPSEATTTPPSETRDDIARAAPEALPPAPHQPALPTGQGSQRAVSPGAGTNARSTERSPVSGKAPTRATASAGRNEPAQSKAAPSSSGAASAAVQEVLPEVPPRSRRTIRGHVRVSVRVIVEQDGTVFAALAEHRGPSRYFERLAVDAAKKWTFTPSDSTAQRLMLVKFDFTREGTTADAVALK